ncbi:MAG: tRNA modification GTPase [Phycisphaerales bacterium JB043]
MRAGETIVAQASAPGASPRCVIRLSGDLTSQALTSLGVIAPASRGAISARIAWDDTRQLPALLLWMPGPQSYTGENCAELQVPASRALVDRLVDRLVLNEGCRRAEPGEFSARAYLHGRISIEQAEGIAWRIASRNEAELRASRDVMEGRAGDQIRAHHESIAQCLALVEAGIDFTDQEDVVPISTSDLLARVSRVELALRDRLSGAGSHKERGHRARVAIVGAPSAGKSTLFNTLLGRARAQVHEEPSTTRDVLTEALHLDDILPGWSVELQDMAGLDADPTDAPSRAAQDSARDAIAHADVLLWCDPDARFFDERLAHTDARVVRVRTKADLPGHTEDSSSHKVCALDGWGIDAIRHAISDAAWSSTHSRAGAQALVLPRHENAMRDAHASIRSAISLLEPTSDSHAIHDVELVAGELRDALDALGQIAGRIDPDQIIGRVFASFCVGK